MDASVELVLRRQAALARFGGSALQEADLQKILDEAVRLCAEGMGVPFCKIVEHRPSRADLVIRAGIGWREGVIGQALAKADASTPVGRAFVTGEPVITKNVQQDADFSLPPLYAEYGIRSSVNTIIQGYGVLEVDSPDLLDFNRDDIAFITGFANVVAAAVNRFRREAALHNLAEERGIFLRELVHRIRNNLQSVAVLAELFRRESQTREAQERLTEIGRRIMVLATLYDQLMGVDMPKAIDLGEYVETLCANVRAFYAAAAGIALECQTERALAALDTATSLGIIVNELISNSFEHAFPQQHGRITVTLRPQGPDQLSVTVADTGIGMEDELTRTGLSLVRRLVEQLDGSIERRPGAGTTWEIVIPLRPI